jgi:hypothetical protein
LATETHYDLAWAGTTIGESTTPDPDSHRCAIFESDINPPHTMM